MEIFRFDQEVGKQINAYQSILTMSRIGTFDGEFHIGCMHLDHNGLVGRHNATSDQLFLVIEGSGWVSGESDEKVAIKAGEAAYWVEGESHEAGTFDCTMKALVIEAKKLSPEKFMPKVERYKVSK